MRPVDRGDLRVEWDELEGLPECQQSYPTRPSVLDTNLDPRLLEGPVNVVARRPHSRDTFLVVTEALLEEAAELGKEALVCSVLVNLRLSASHARLRMVDKAVAFSASVQLKPA